MRAVRTTGVAAGVAAMLALSPMAPASAINNIKNFGVQETLKNFVSLGDFNSEIGYTVRNLRPSRDAVPYPVAGRLYEANVTSTAILGTVSPQVPNFIARTADGVDYRALTPVSTLSGAPLGQGGTATGKLYFDVVGPNPDSVIYNDQSQDLLGWVGQQPVDPDSVVPGTDAGGAVSPGGGSSGSDTSSGGADVPGSTGPMQATPPNVGGGVQNGPYGPLGSIPPIGGG